MVTKPAPTHQTSVTGEVLQIGEPPGSARSYWEGLVLQGGDKRIYKIGEMEVSWDFHYKTNPEKW